MSLSRGKPVNEVVAQAKQHQGYSQPSADFDDELPPF